jgi:hypothetical protein
MGGQFATELSHAYDVLRYFRMTKQGSVWARWRGLRHPEAHRHGAREQVRRRRAQVPAWHRGDQRAP